jgi:MFS family permease
MNTASQPLATAASSLRAAVIFATSIAVVNGFARFAYALLLPIMREDLQWDYALSGWLNTANSLGYGVGALAGLFLLTYVRPAALFVGGLVATVLTLILCGVTQNLWLMMALRLLAGIGSAWVFACGGALVAAYYNNGTSGDRSAAAIAIYYAGGGLGISLSGLLLLPVLNAAAAKASTMPSVALAAGAGMWTWQTGWLLLGVAGLLLTIWPAMLALTIRGEKAVANPQPLTLGPLAPILLAYFLFGVGYIGYLTFVIAWMREMKLDVASSVSVWLIMGVAAMASGYVWRKVMTTWWPSRTFALSCVCTGLGTLLPIANQSLPTLMISATLVGGSFFMAPGAMMALARASLPSYQWAKCMNLFTFIFAVGQAAGPVLAGWIADHYSLNLAMLFGAVTLFVAGAVAMAQKPKRVAIA